MKTEDNFLVLTLDALRYDSAVEARIPKLRELMQLYGAFGAKDWVKCYAPGIYTLPSHVSMLQAGCFPSTRHPDVGFPYNTTTGQLIRFDNHSRPKDAMIALGAQAPNIPKAFQYLGHKVIGIGGVGWFNERATSDIWSNYFRDFHWNTRFSEGAPKNAENQFSLLTQLGIREESRRLFLFINCAATHDPYRRESTAFPSRNAQVCALEDVDAILHEIITYVPRPLNVIICGDHGDCFGEDGLWGHGFYHPKVMEVPMICLEIP